MTCIIGLKTENGILIGGDSAISLGDTVRKLANPKVFRRGQFIIGVCDSLRVLQLVRYKLAIPPIRGKDLHKYMVTDFVDAMRKCFKLAGAARKENEEEEVSGNFVIGIRDRLFIIFDDYAVEEVSDGMSVSGSGEEYAYGSLYSSRGDPDDERRVLDALEAASYFCASVGPPFIILKVKVKNDKKERIEGESGCSGSESKEADSGEEPKISESASTGDQ